MDKLLVTGDKNDIIIINSKNLYMEKIMKKYFFIFAVFLLPIIVLAYGIQGGEWLSLQSNVNYSLDTKHNYYHHPQVSNWNTYGGQLLQIQYTNSKGAPRFVATIFVVKGTVKHGNPQDGAMQLYLKCLDCKDGTASFKIKDNLCYEASAQSSSGEWGAVSGCFEEIKKN